MADWSLEQLLSSLHDDIQQKLSLVRRSIHHPGSKGDASEEVWLELLQTYLPKRYEAAKAHVVDSKGQFSEQIGDDVFAVLTLEGSVNARDHIGGTAPNQVRAAVARGRELLATR